MFDFLLSEEKKMRRHASNWLEVAARVLNFRRDQLSETQLQRLTAATGELRARIKEKADAGRTKIAIEKLEAVLRDTGGRHYPQGSLAENVEFFLVAALVILGLRAYFVQPFKIPTNSMWPSYYGMTAQVFADGAEPGLLGQAARLVAFGAVHHRVESPVDGEVYVPAFATGPHQVRCIGSEVRGRFLGVFGTENKEWTFAVDGAPGTGAGDGTRVQVSVPVDFDFESVLQERFAGKGGSLSDYLLEQARKSGHDPESSVVDVKYGGQTRPVRVYWLPTGLKVRKGQTIVSFDVLTGDLLFVDRITYNFFAPNVGQGFVFKTGNIPDLRDEEGNKYFVKRLVGVPGDDLEIRAPALWRNGKPIEGATAFGRNARQEGLYPGYTNDRSLVAGAHMVVPPHFYMGLGDNSPRSKDSRYWGFIPEKDVVGKPLFIYYPLSTRWGVAH